MNPVAVPIDEPRLADRYASLPTNELLAILRAGSEGYEADALAAARAELEDRGLDAQAAADDEQRRRGHALAEREGEDLPRWAHWVCLIDGALISLLVLVWLGSGGRVRAVRQGIMTMIVGWGLKFLLGLAAVLVYDALSV